jgi:uncharacterized BrkB/YihY/UPF0761 family membrane protein
MPLAVFRGVTLSRLVSVSSKSLGFGAIIGMVITLRSGLNGMSGMMTAITIAYVQPARRGFFTFYVTGATAIRLGVSASPCYS